MRSTSNPSEEEELPLMKRAWKESKLMWEVAVPAIFTRFSTFGINIISQAFVGHIGSKELAAFALVFTIVIRFANGILLGMASALSTLCGQAYGGKEYGMMGVFLQRSWIVLFLTALILLPLFFFTSPILRILHQEETIAQVAGTISLWSIPVIFAFIVSYTCQTFLQSQSKNTVIAFLAVFSLMIHTLLSWILTIKYKLGITGAMTSTSLAYWIPNIGQLIFITCGWCPETWKGFTFLAFKDLWPIAKLSLSSGAMMCLELWYNTILVLLTGSMENAEVEIDALSICLNINGWAMMISLGFMAAASVRVSNELGRGSPKAAKFSIVVTVLTSFTIGFLLFILFLILRERLAYIFTSNKDVATAVGGLSPLLAVSIVLNSVQPVLSGVAVGAGWQNIVAYVNVGCYYIIGIPAGVILGRIIHLQVKGIWIGMLTGTLIQTIVVATITYKTDWDKQVIKARDRINRWSNKVGSDLETITNNTSNNNYDVVHMLSYAPLFVNNNDRTWTPDTIVFDSHQPCGTPSYRLQQLFSESSGAMSLNSTLQTSSNSIVASAIEYKNSADDISYLKIKVVNFGSNDESLQISINGLNSNVQQIGSNKDSAHTIQHNG